MAEDVRGTGPVPNGNGLKLDLQHRTIAFTGKDAIVLLFVAIIGAGLWLRSKDLSKDLQDIATDLKALHAQQDTLKTAMLEQNTFIERKTQQQGEKLHDQSTQLIVEIREQTKDLTAQSLRLEERIEQGMKALWSALITFNENLRRDPAAQLPLGVLPPREGPPGGQR